MVSSDHLAPGASGKIKASVNTAGRAGRMIKHITLRSNDPSNPLLSFSLVLNVVPK